MSIPSFTLNNGAKMPAVGLGCWMGEPGQGPRAFEMCQKALRLGYRHLDTAAGYANEKYVGDAIKQSGIPRKELFVTTKLPIRHSSVQESFEQSLKELDCEYIDLYLIHWPQVGDPKDPSHILRPDEHPNFVDAWKEMEKLMATGKVVSIGVSNFSVKTLQELLPHCSVIPAVNQVELHPCLPQNELKAFCDEKGIVVTAYSPLGRSTTFYHEPAIQSIAAKVNASAAQVVLSWSVQRGNVVIPKSENEGRLKENITLIQLSLEDLKAVDELHTAQGKHKSLLKYHRPDRMVFGWTYEWLGWNMVEGGIVPS